MFESSLFTDCIAAAGDVKTDLVYFLYKCMMFVLSSLCYNLSLDTLIFSYDLHFLFSPLSGVGVTGMND